MLYDQRWSDTKLDAAGQLLQSAADYIDTHGLCKGKLREGDLACPIGAINIFKANTEHAYAAKMRLQRYIYECYPNVYHSIPTWSDASSKDEVVSGMRTAARMP